MRILTVSEMQALEKAANAAGHTYDAMMRRAGAAVALAIQQRSAVTGRHVVILVGPGNNGADGLVAGHRLAERGAVVSAYLTHPRDEADDAVFRAAKAAGVKPHALDDSSADLEADIAAADIIIDALLGTGATPPLRAPISTSLEKVRAFVGAADLMPLIYVRRGLTSRPRQLIVAVDGPSGLNFDTGEIDGIALRADITVTFAAPKWGHVRMPGAGKVGELIIADIGIPDSVRTGTGPELATPQKIASWLPERSLDAHKGTFGKALIIAGSANYAGAAVLAAKAAVRAGTGLVTLGTPSSLQNAIVSAIPEVTYLLLPHSLGVLNQHAVPVVRTNMQDYSAILIGPGLGNTPESRGFLTALLEDSDHQRTTGFIKHTADGSSKPTLPPLVIDADGLNILATLPDWAQRVPKDTILTPHPGEMARLTKLSIEEIQDNRLEIAQEWADRWAHTVVLKGAFTVIAAPDQQPVILPFANPGLSSAGTGDVLAGTIIALRAQGLAPFPAAVAGAYIHGLAGDIATTQYGAAGTAASDVVAALAVALRRLTPDR